MSTRCVVGVYTRTKYPSEFEGRYVHHDGKPSGVGQWLFEEYRRLLRGNMQGMIDLLMSERVGWSALCRRDLSLPPVWEDIGYGRDQFPTFEAWLAWENTRPLPPIAYSCRAEQPISKNPRGDLITRYGDPCGTEWAYIFDPANEHLDIWDRRDGEWHSAFSIWLDTPDSGYDWREMDGHIKRRRSKKG
jgi:hypothetical protein